jgi:FkbM family methyltransferase
MMNSITLKRWLKILLGKDLLILPQVNCPTLKYGRDEYDWTFCPVSINKDSIVYSFGVGHDISFDLALIKTFGLKVFAFDPTPKSVAWLKTQSLPSEFQYYPLGLSDHDGTMEFFESGGEQAVSYTEVKSNGQDDHNRPVHLQVCKLSTICSTLRHDHIDILKLDIEGSEYRVIPDILQSNIHVDQILVEFHHWFREIKVAQTRELIKIMNRRGYMIFNISTNGYEYSFIRK